MAEAKTRTTDASVEDFIASVENPRRRADAAVAMAIYKKVTGHPPVMWGPAIIGFGQSYFLYPNGTKSLIPAACFSPRKANLTFYVGGDFEGSDALYMRLGKHTKSGGCLHISNLDDVDLAVLTEIIASRHAVLAARGAL